MADRDMETSVIIPSAPHATSLLANVSKYSFIFMGLFGGVELPEAIL